MKTLLLVLLIPLCSLSLQAQTTTPTGNAQFTFFNSDPAGEGFNDLTLATTLSENLIGNNPGATVGELRQNVLTAAGARWSQYLKSNVPIIVNVNFEDLGDRSPDGGIVLAGASAAEYVINFTNAPRQNIIYPIALANSLAGFDIRPSSQDILTSINSNPDLDGSWYYGLDSNAPFGSIDLLDTITHELGHGLGYASTYNVLNGAFASPFPDIFSTFILDSSTGLKMDEASNEQRIASSVNDPNLVWDGPYSNAAADGVNDYLNAGKRSFSAEGTILAANQARFGGAIPAEGITATIVLINDGQGNNTPAEPGTIHDAASNIINGAEIRGNIAFIERGESTFNDKVQRAEDVGALAVVIMNNRDGDQLLSPTSASATPPSIPMIFISENSGISLKAELLNTPDLQVTLSASSLHLNTSTDSQVNTRIRLHAPSIANTGSSVSHWTAATSPNLLMEPSINGDISSGIDLSPLLLKDIGWETCDITIPHKTYELWLSENGISTALNNTPSEDLDKDGLLNIIEYMQGQDPTINTPGLNTGLTIGASTLTYERSTITNDVQLTYEYTSDVNAKGQFNWASINLTESSEVIDTQHERITLPLPSLPATSAGFYRYKVQIVD